MKKQIEQDYADAFNATPTEDEDAGSMDAQPMSEETAPGAQEAQPEVAPVDTAAVEQATEPATSATETETPTPVVDVALVGADTDAMSPEDVQREKSWEGRLRKREEELAAREAAMQSEGEQQGERHAPGEALAKLADQFGDEFADLIVQVIDESAGKGIGEDIAAIRSEVAQVVEDLQFAMHRRDILAAKADAYEIGETPEFKEWCASQDDAAECQRIVGNGSASEVIGLMNRYDAYLKQEQAGGDEAGEEATAVRGSAPISLPKRAALSQEDEYRAAWNAE